MIPLNTVVEDDLGRAVLNRVFREFRSAIEPRSFVVAAGKSRIDNRLASYNRAARSLPHIVLRDLDHDSECAPELIPRLFPSGVSRYMLTCIAVREVEAWLLADRRNCARFLGVRMNDIPYNPEHLEDPKRMIIALARKSRSKDIRDAIPPRPGSTAAKGRGYNGELGRFIMTMWDIGEAAENAPSFARLVRKLEYLIKEYRS